MDWQFSQSRFERTYEPDSETGFLLPINAMPNFSASVIKHRIPRFEDCFNLIVDELSQDAMLNKYQHSAFSIKAEANYLNTEIIMLPDSLKKMSKLNADLFLECWIEDYAEFADQEYELEEIEQQIPYQSSLTEEEQHSIVIESSRPYLLEPLLWVQSYDLHPDEMSEILGIESTRSTVKGETGNKGKPNSINIWRLEVSPDEEPFSLDQLIKELLDKMYGQRGNLHKLRSMNCEPMIKVDWFYDFYVTREYISNEIIKEIASFNIPLFIDLYLEE